MHGQELRKYLDRKAMTAFATVPITGAIRPIHTDKLPAVVEPPSVKIIPLANVQAALINLTDVSQARILQGLRLAYINQRIPLTDALYVIRDVWPDLAHPEKFYARVEREDG